MTSEKYLHPVRLRGGDHRGLRQLDQSDRQLREPPAAAHGPERLSRDLRAALPPSARPRAYRRGHPPTLWPTCRPTLVAAMAGTGSIPVWIASNSPSTTAGYANTIQVRLTDSGPGGHGNPTGTYWESDIGYNTTASPITVDGTTVPANGWAQLFPLVTPSTTELTATPPSPEIPGTQVTLKATELQVLRAKCSFTTVRPRSAHPSPSVPGPPRPPLRRPKVATATRRTSSPPWVTRPQPIQPAPRSSANPPPTPSLTQSALR